MITIEDSAELQLQGLPNLVRLETRNGNTEGCREIGNPGTDPFVSANAAGPDHCRRGPGTGGYRYAAVMHEHRP